MAANQIINRIRKELIETGRDSRYRIGGYEFILNGMEFYLTSIGEKRHVTGQELTRELLLFAQKQFGPLARSVLNYWGIQNTADLGNIVYNMIDIGIMSKKPDDSIEHFNDIIDIASFFHHQEYFKVEKEAVKRIKGA
jgi:uncharacterized repeat protein (TIGR04138 family)